MHFSKYEYCAGRTTPLASVGQISYFTLVFGAIAALFIAFSRRGLAGGELSLAVALVHLAALVGCILLAVWSTTRRRNTIWDAALGFAAGSLVGILLPFMGFFLGRYALVAEVPLALVGVVMVAAIVLKYSLIQFIYQTLAAAISSIVIAVTYNGDVYSHVFSPEFLVLGWQSPDATFHPAIAALLSRYGIPTIGLDGTPALFYHVLSHLVFAGASLESGEAAYFSYPAMHQTFLIPAFITTSAFTVSALCNFDKSTVIPSMVIAAIFFLAMLSGSFSDFFQSESYTLSLALTSCAVPLILAGPGRGWRDAVEWSLIVALVGLAAILSKYTLVLLWVLLVGWVVYKWLRQQHPKLAMGVLVAVATLYIAFVLGLSASILQISPVSVSDFWPFARAQPRVLLLNLTIVLAASYAVARVSLSNDLHIDGRFLVIALILLHLPCLWLDGLSAEYYWFHPLEWMSILILLAVATNITVAPVLLGTIIAIFASFIFKSNLFRYRAYNLSSTLDVLQRLADMDVPPEGNFDAKLRAHALGRKLVFPAAPKIRRPFRIIASHLAHGFDPSPMATINRSRLAVATANVNAALANTGFPRPGLYVGPEHFWYWESHRNCIARRVSFQALTGVAMIFGLPPSSNDCPNIKAYGMLDYRDRSRNRALDDAELCSAAEDRALSPILRLNEADNTVSIVCRNPDSSVLRR